MAMARTEHTHGGVRVCVVGYKGKGGVFHGITTMNNTRWAKLAARLGPLPRGQSVRGLGTLLEFLIELGGGMANRKCVKDTRISFSLGVFFFLFLLCFLATKLQMFWSANLKFAVSSKSGLKYSLDLCKYLRCIDRHNLRWTVVSSPHHPNVFCSPSASVALMMATRKKCNFIACAIFHFAFGAQINKKWFFTSSAWVFFYYIHI